MKRLGGAVGLLLTVVMIAGAAQGVASATTAGWHTVPTPDPSRTTLDAVSCSSPTACTAVGEASVGSGNVSVSSGGSASSSSSDGTRGRVSNAIIRTRSLAVAEQVVERRLAAAAATRLDAKRQYHGWAVAERWDGATWRRQKLPAIPHTELAELEGVACPAVNECVAVGDYAANNSYDHALAEVWNGHRWRRVAFPAIAASSVSCTSATHCLAVGYPLHGESLHPGARLRPVAARWNGRQWMEIHLAAGAPNQFLELTSISCSTASACETYGERFGLRQFKGGFKLLSHTFAEGWNGTRWAVQTTPAVGTVTHDVFFFADVACATAARCIAVGTVEKGRGDQQIVEAWNGAHWTRQAWPATRSTDVEGAACLPDGSCTLVGLRIAGNHVTTTAYGSTATTGWTEERTPQVQDSERALLGVTGTGNTWVAVGARISGALVEMRS